MKSATQLADTILGKAPGARVSVEFTFSRQDLVKAIAWAREEKMSYERDAEWAFLLVDALIAGDVLLEPDYNTDAEFEVLS